MRSFFLKDLLRIELINPLTCQNIARSSSHGDMMMRSELENSDYKLNELCIE